MLSLADLNEALESSDADWLAGETEMSALIADVGTENVFGLALSDDERDELFGAARAAEEDSGLFAAPGPLPASFDWREGGWPTVPSSQGSCQACVAFASCAAFEARVRIGAGNSQLQIDLSEADLFFGAGRDCSIGWQFEPALTRARDNGVGLESAYPWAQGPPPMTIPPVVKITGWDAGTSVEARKVALVNSGPIICGMETFEDLSYYKGGIYEHVAGDATGKHAVCVVGYNDGSGCWVVKNSWGTDWGEGGFFRLKYGACGLDTQFPFYDPVVLYLGLP